MRGRTDSPGHYLMALGRDTVDESNRVSISERAINICWVINRLNCSDIYNCQNRSCRYDWQPTGAETRHPNLRLPLIKLTFSRNDWVIAGNFLAEVNADLAIWDVCRAEMSGTLRPRRLTKQVRQMAWILRFAANFYLWFKYPNLLENCHS